MSYESDNSTACSSPTNDTIGSVFKNDSVRYKQKGYGIIFAIIISASFLFGFPILFKEIMRFAYQYVSPGAFWVILSSPINSLVYATGNIFMYFIYKMKSPFFERYKILDQAWPWERIPAKWKHQFRRSMKFLALAHFVIIPVLALSEHYILTKEQPEQRTDFESFPGYLEIIGQIVFCMLMEDFTFYWIHRFLHYPPMYKRIHKIHHEYYDTVSISSEHAHPLEFVFGNLLPSVMGFKLLGGKMHICTMFMFSTIRSLETIDGHCGYEFSWSPFRLLPLSGSSRYHNFHHHANIGNYSSFFTYWDTICGTNKVYFKHISKEDRKLQTKELERKLNAYKQETKKDL